MKHLKKMLWWEIQQSSSLNSPELRSKASKYCYYPQFPKTCGIYRALRCSNGKNIFLYKYIWTEFRKLVNTGFSGTGLKVKAKVKKCMKKLPCLILNIHDT